MSSSVLSTQDRILFNAAVQFRGGSNAEGKRIFSEVCKEPRNAEHGVYYHMWNLNGRHLQVNDAGRKLFHDADGYFSPATKKSNAIYIYLLSKGVSREVIEPIRPLGLRGGDSPVSNHWEVLWCETAPDGSMQAVAVMRSIDPPTVAEDETLCPILAGLCCKCSALTALVVGGTALVAKLVRG